MRKNCKNKIIRGQFRSHAKLFSDLIRKISSRPCVCFDFLILINEVD